MARTYYGTDDIVVAAFRLTLPNVVTKLAENTIPFSDLRSMVADGSLLALSFTNGMQIYRVCSK